MMLYIPKPNNTTPAISAKNFKIKNRKTILNSNLFYKAIITQTINAIIKTGIPINKTFLTFCFAFA